MLSIRAALSSVVLGLLALTSVGCSSAAKGAGEEELLIEPTRVYVVQMHADWCATCRVLGPRVAEAVIDAEDEPIRFIKVDYTDTTLAVGKRTLGDLGLMSLFEANSSGSPDSQRTGIVYFVDVETKAVLGSLKGTKPTVADISAEIRRAVEDARAG